MPDLVAVVDETGTTNRPGVADGDGFGVGAVLFPEPATQSLIDRGRLLGRLLNVGDYKYKHVQRNSLARQHFLRTLNADALSVLCFGMYVSGAALAKEDARERGAAERYGEVPSEARQESLAELSDDPRRYLLKSFIQYMAPCIGAYAVTRGQRIRVLWDNRSDLEFIRECWSDALRRQAEHPAYRRSAELAVLDGAAVTDMNHVARLSGVLAGDIRQFFDVRGDAIWQRLDPHGLPDVVDPIRAAYRNVSEPPVVAKLTEPLTSDDPAVAAPRTCMLAGYYKRLLQGLLSFCDPDGRMGYIRVRHRCDWDVIQLPD